MASILENLDSVTSDQFAEGSKEFITALAATPQKAAKVSLVAATQGKEMESLRHAARDAGYTLSKIRNTPVVTSEDGSTVILQLMLGKLIQVAPGQTRNRKKGNDAASVDVPTPEADPTAAPA